MDSYQPNDLICMLRVRWYAPCALREPQAPARPPPLVPSPLTQTARYKGPMRWRKVGLFLGSIEKNALLYRWTGVVYLALSSQLCLVNLPYLFS